MLVPKILLGSCLSGKPIATAVSEFTVFEKTGFNQRSGGKSVSLSNILDFDDCFLSVFFNNGYFIICFINITNRSINDIWEGGLNVNISG